MVIYYGRTIKQSPDEQRTNIPQWYGTWWFTMFDSIKYHLKLNKQSSWFFWWIFFSKLGISPKFQISKIQWNITWGKNKTFWWWSELCFILFLCQVLIFCFFFRPIFCEIMSYLPSSPFPTGNPDSTPMVFGSNFPVPSTNQLKKWTSG